MTGSYTYLRKEGRWGIRVSGLPAPGDHVTVFKKEFFAPAETVVVRDVVWTDGVTSLCTIAERTTEDGSWDKRYNGETA